MDKQGFTLMELLITMVIIGILATAATSAYVGTMKKAARSEAYSNLQNLRLLQEQFFAENADYAPLGGGALVGDAAIQGFLRGFRPGTGMQFIYRIDTVAGSALPTPVPVPYDGSVVPFVDPVTGQPLPCFIAQASGNPAIPRVAGDIFAIDCNNNRNF